MPKKLTDKQAKFLERRLLDRTDSHKNQIGSLRSHLDLPAGEVAHHLSWQVEKIMQAEMDLVTHQECSRVLNDDESPATLENVTEYYTREHRRWAPGRSTGVGANLLDDAKLFALKSVLETLEHLKRS